MNTPLLYIIAINYNSSEHTIEMVRSVLNSDYQNLKIVIVDNASDTPDYQKLDAIKTQAVILRNEKNLGFSGGNNIGIHYAIEHMAEYIMILNNDTTVETNAISHMMNMVLQEGVDVVSPKILFFYEDQKFNYAGGNLKPYKGGITIRGLKQTDQGQFDQRTEVTFMHGCCTLASVQTWQDVDFLDERYFLYYEDVALSHSFYREGKKMWYCPEAVIYHKESASTKKYSANYQYYLCRNRLMYIKENIQFPVKIAAYGYSVLFALKNLKRHNFQFKNVWEAVHDFVYGIDGCRTMKHHNAR